MDNLNELFSSYYDEQNNSPERTEQPKHTHPLFELAIETQIECRTLFSDLTEKSMEELADLMVKKTDELDKIAIDSKMFDSPIILTGDTIETPTVKKLLESNTVMVTSQAKNDLTLDDQLLGRSVSGLFYGFDTRYETVSEGDQLVGLRPVIIFQVKIGSFRSPHAAGNIFATGDVGSAQLEFLEDYERRMVAETMKPLLTHENAFFVDSVRYINELLSSDESVSALTMRHIGHEVEKICSLLGKGVDQVDLDLIIDLLGHYINFTDVRHISVRPILKLPRINEKLNKPIEIIDQQPMTVFDGRINSFTILPKYRIEKNILVETGEQTIYATVMNHEASWFMKLTDLSTF